MGPAAPPFHGSLPVFLHKGTQVGCRSWSPWATAAPAAALTAASQHSCPTTCQAALTHGQEQRALKEIGCSPLHSQLKHGENTRTPGCFQDTAPGITTPWEGLPVSASIL